MDIINHTVLAWLEEDNQRLGHFRVRPLLRETGPFTPAETGEWRDDGYVRVVPDKSEQRSCKERLRSLGDFCLLRLTGNHADKFKPNKNYAPAKGEKNRYIVYSNAVEALPEQMFYEVVPESMLPRAATARVYARLGGKIRGPVDRQTGQSLDDARQLPPDDPRIFSVTLPDGAMRLFYWPLPEVPAAEELPSEAPAATPAEAEAPQEPQTALDQIKALDEQVRVLLKENESSEAAKKPKEVLIADDAGTPLYHVQVEAGQEKPKRNSLAQAVESSRKAAEKTAAPAKKKAERARAASAEKAEPAKPADALESAWSERAERPALVEKLLKLPGARQLAAKAMGGGDDPVLAALKAQLQDMEAERLMTVMNLNRAREQEAQYRETLIAGLVQGERREIDMLKAEAAEAEKTLKELSEKRGELVLALEEQTRGTGLEVCAAGEAAEDPPIMTVIRRIAESLKAAGFACCINDAAALLTACGICGPNGIRLKTACAADGKDAAAALVAALGGKIAANGRILPGGSAVLALLMPAEVGGYTPSGSGLLHIYYGNAEPIGVLESMPRAEFMMVQSGEFPMEPAASPAADWTKLRQKLRETQTPLSGPALGILQTLRRLCGEHGIQLPLAVLRDMDRFAGIAQNLMEGGITAALDHAVLLYAVPVIGKVKNTDFLAEFCRAMPLTRAALELK